MSQLSAAAQQFFAQEEGATMVEYGLMLALIAVVCIAAVSSIGTGVKLKFTAVGNSLQAAS